MTRGGEEPLQSARVLITGAHGFVGRHLIRALENQRPGWTLIAPESLTQAGLDISQAHSVNACIAAATPDIVVHLAGVAAVTSATNDPRHAWAVNAGGVLNLLLAIDQFAPQAKLLHVSTAEVYGASLATGEPTSETAVLRPTNAYAATKAAGDILAGQFARNGRPTVIARPFNHIGTGQSEAFAISNFAAQIARIEAGLQPPTLFVGSLDEERDFLAVDDVVQAYIELISSQRFGSDAVFNIASGKSTRIGGLLDQLLSMSYAAIEVRQDPERLRPAALRRAVGDASKLRSELGWAPRRAMNETLAAILEDKRAAIIRHTP